MGLDKEGKLEKKKIVVKCSDIWCRLVNMCEWLAGYLFLVPYSYYTPGILCVCLH